MIDRLKENDLPAYGESSPEGRRKILVRRSFEVAARVGIALDFSPFDGSLPIALEGFSCRHQPGP